MSNIKTLLAATDFSDRADWAERRAALICAEQHCNVAELMTVVEDEQLDEFEKLMNRPSEVAKSELADLFIADLQKKSSQLAREYGPRLSCAVEFGQPAKEIAGRSESIGADLIVIGAHGANFFRDLLVGNTADRLIRRCRQPLLIVKNKPVFEYRHILVPVDFSAESRQAAQLALLFGPQATFTFLHAYDLWFLGKMQYAGVSQEAIDHYRAKVREDTRSALNGFIDGLNVPHSRLNRHFVHGHPSAIVRDYVEQSQPDLIVMGKHGRSWIEEWIVGSVTRDTIDGTKCDIMIVPPLAAKKDESV
jgi:nucleotide-binding universal stress UspA family protein